MKKSLLMLLLFTSCNAFADKIPDSVENLIAVFDTRTHSLESGVLSIKYSKQNLHIDAADAMFEGICTDLSMHKWKPETIKKIRLLNVSLDQGFEIDAGGAECKKTGKMPFDEARAYRQGFIKPIP
ncbi:hypothetical protein ACORB7_004807 [Klebsiella pneumoniae]|uniref:hypothetical protein n=1 Tax=Klebsiella pneumoniae complex TaxID=3390273 RepID=UPI00049F617F|nr:MULTISPECIES: hypothetical protein [Klebsiella]HDT5015831.1 hypothetical protein [Klebsiella pneumoniae subsp. pneumoniae]KDM03220.1 hypothetical protein AE06_03070 [Klebsiella variicola]MCS6356483.1 hypothetical protein [Klebsiella pneumoniae]MDF9979269.1 hypothetical protein [Klebsiella pneumoniae]MDF9999668.1 hypothetical protein [Klebsiella pneumoniae]